MKAEIKIHQGFDTIVIGSTKETVERLLGNADEIETIDTLKENDTIVCYYPDMTLFFDSEKEILVSLEVRNEEATLWEKEIFNLDEKSIVKLMAEHGYGNHETDNEVWGERILSFEEANVEFCFEEGTLTAVNISK